MRFHALALSVVLALAACASGRTTDDGLERSATKPEVVHSIDDGEALPPALPPTAPEPEPPKSRTSGIDPFAEERGTIGFDPRKARESLPEARKSASSKIPQHPGLGKMQPELMAPMAGRVGVMSLLGNQLTHINASTFSSQRKDHWVQFNLGGYVSEELRSQLLQQTPYQPIPVNPTGLLRRDHDSWHESWNGESFAPQYQREIDSVISQNRLDMLIVVSYRKIAGGMGSPELSGSGLLTRSVLGSTSAAVFSTFQFYRLVGTPAKLVEPIMAPGDRSVGALPDAKLPDDLENLSPQYLAPVYAPLRQIVKNKVQGLVKMPRRLGQ